MYLPGNPVYLSERKRKEGDGNMILFAGPDEDKIFYVAWQWIETEPNCVCVEVLKLVGDSTYCKKELKQDLEIALRERIDYQIKELIIK